MMSPPRENAVIKQKWQAVRDFVYGLTGYQFARHAREMKQEVEAILFITTVGDLVGVPVIPPLFALRLLPHLAPKITAWKRRLARKKEFWEKEEYDLHSV